MKKLEDLIKGFQILAEKFKKLVESIDWVKIKQVLEYLTKQLPKGIENLSVELANRGWFIWVWDFDTPLEEVVDKLSNLIGKCKEDQDNYLAGYITSQIEAIEQELLIEYPDRTKQIEDSFKTHKLKLYSASVPTLICLSEGICRDHYPRIGLYSKHTRDKKNKKPGMPKTNDIFDKIPPLEVYEEMVLKPLKISSDVTKTIRNPNNEEQKMFNRHLIIHGLSKEYGTKANSLKAVSLAYFIHKSLCYLKKKSKKRDQA